MDSTNLATPPAHKPPPAFMRTAAWAVTGLQYAFAIVAAIGLVPMPPALIQAAGGAALVVAMLLNVGGYRPERHSERVEGPLPTQQHPRVIHALAAVAAFILLVVLTGGPVVN